MDEFMQPTEEEHEHAASFRDHVMEHSHSYGTKEEYAFRFDIYRKNIEEIMSWNADPNNTHKLEVNKFSTMTEDEKKKMLGFKMPNIE
jgi:hypothetical protein